MHKKRFTKLKHRIVGIAGQYAPDMVPDIQKCLTDLEGKIPFKNKNKQ